jgi:nicotinate-nucleotide adenylyltransferase
MCPKTPRKVIGEQAGMTRRSAGAIALFGGSFDPIHSGHLDVAHAAMEEFQLNRVIFIPSGVPPHKRRQRLASFVDRFAMVTLACAHCARFVPSSAEAGTDQRGRKVIYSVDTVRRFRHANRGRYSNLYFILGADQFLDISKWRESKTLLGLTNFIVANRPGFQREKLRSAVPADLLRPGTVSPHADHHQTIHLQRTNVYVLESVASHVSATEVRRRVRDGKSIRGLVPPLVEEYIQKQGLYR